jgi:hypothetical protein
MKTDIWLNIKQVLGVGFMCFSQLLEHPPKNSIQKFHKNPISSYNLHIETFHKVH